MDVKDQEEDMDVEAGNCSEEDMEVDEQSLFCNETFPTSFIGWKWDITEKQTVKGIQCSDPPKWRKSELHTGADRWGFCCPRTENKGKKLGSARDKCTVGEVTLRCNDSPTLFSPTDAKWRSFQSSKLGITEVGINTERVPGVLFGDPAEVDSTKGDGNCLFRAISKEVAGNENVHMTIRQMAVTIMTDQKYRKEFEDYSGYRSIETYLSESGMKNDGVWATDIELVAVASLLNTPIVVHTDRLGLRKWIPYNPLIEVPPVLKTNQKIYLTHYKQHFERVLSMQRY